jgi:hypothetical protein
VTAYLSLEKPQLHSVAVKVSKLTAVYVTFRLSAERARRLFVEVDRAARRLEQLAEGRRERLRDLARVRALEDETAQVSFLLSL